MALSACAAKQAETPPAPKFYDKPSSADLCTRFDYGLLAEVITHMSAAPEDKVMSDDGLSAAIVCTRGGRVYSFGSTAVEVIVATYLDAGGATRTLEGEFKRYGGDPKPLPQLTKQVEQAVANNYRPGDNWIYLVDGNLRITIHLSGHYAGGDVEEARLLEAEVRFAENVLGKVREALLNKT